MTFREIDSLTTLQYIHDRLYEYNLSKTGDQKKEIILKADPPRYGWYVSCSNGMDIAGGIVYQLLANGEMYVDFLWLDDSLRGKGVGRKLLDLAKSRAQELKCPAITLYTSTFQAPEFYRNYGFALTCRKGEKFFYRMELFPAESGGK